MKKRIRVLPHPLWDNPDSRRLLSCFGLFLAGSAISCLAALIIFLDVFVFGSLVNETSATEFCQEIILLVIAVCFFKRARATEDMREAHVLIGGFFACLFIREMSSWLNFLWGGIWVHLALAVAAVCIVYALRAPGETLKELAAFTHTPGYWMMASALVLILFFSRIFGMGVLWKALLEGGYARTAKNIAEEGVELIGYCQCLFATAHYLLSHRGKDLFR